MAAQQIYLSLLAKAAGNSEQIDRILPHVAALVKIDAQMDRLVSDLVDLVAIDAGRLSVTLEPRSVTELISTATAFFAPLAKERGQSLLVTPLPPDVSVFADATRVVQVLGNLLSNAVKFTPSGGTIRIGFEVASDEVTLSVADNGPGVPAEQAEHIFERFVGSNSSPRSLGLGLFIAARLIEAHEGRLWLDQSAAAGGVFRFTLRRAR